MNKVLLVEDDRIDQIAFQRFLNKYLPRLEVTIAPSVKEAKDVIQKSQFQFVILDFNLSDGNAFDFVTHLQGIPFLILSGQMDKELSAQAKKLGATAFLYKDLNQEYLSTVQQILTPHFSIFTDHPSSSPSSSIKDSNNNKPFNLEKLMNLFDGKDHHVKEVLILFKTQNPQDRALLQKHLKKEDRAAIIHLVHKMKSAYRMLGIPDGFRISEQIEADAKEQRPLADLQNKIDQLNLLSQKVYAYIDEYLDTRK